MKHKLLILLLIIFSTLNAQNTWLSSAGIGSYFLNNQNIISLEWNISYQLSERSLLGVTIDDYTDFGQNNLVVFHRYTFFETVMLYSGMSFHYNRKERELTDIYTFPKNDGKKFTLKNSFYSSLLLQPTVEFRSQNLIISQGISSRFILVGGETHGLAYHFQPFIKISYQIF